MVRGLAVFARPSVFASLVLLSALCAEGCDGLSEFGGKFDGVIVKGSFVRRCFPADLKATLRFNPTYAVGSTRALSDDERNWLTLRNDAGEAFFDAPLEPIYAITADTLADFDFPGQKRLRNYMLFARSSVGPLADRDATVVVSLLATKKIELRVIARAADDDPDCVVEDDFDPNDYGHPTEWPPRYPEYYGLFKLSK